MLSPLNSRAHTLCLIPSQESKKVKSYITQNDLLLLDPLIKILLRIYPTPLSGAGCPLLPVQHDSGGPSSHPIRVHP
jgi:hypothetical protein